MTQYLLNSSGMLDPLSPEKSKTIFHLFVSAVYFTPLIGALISDIWLNKYKTILGFSILYCFGFFALMVDQTRLGLGVGLVLIALGSGVIKPCVSANVGDQFGKSNQHLMSKVYSWFYFSINVGAFIAQFFVVPPILEKYGPGAAFGVTFFLMAIATIAFWLGRRKMVHIRPSGIGFVKECFSGEGLKALGKLCIIYIFVAPFWAIFDQMDSAWVLQSQNMDRVWLGHKWLPSQIAAVNPLMILILIPTFSYLIYPLLNKVFKLTPLRKISIGLFVAASVFVVPAYIEKRIIAGDTPSIVWLFLAHLILASSEVMVSITCLEFSYTQAPKKIKSFIMAVFFLSITLGNAFTAFVNAFIQNEDGTSKLPGASYYLFFVAVMLVTAVLFIFVAALYKEKTYIQDEKEA
jgi:POT family proton-dependent oligopeptide transporter